MLPKTRLRVPAVTCALMARLTAFPCEAAGSLIHPTETGQPRELINQTVCWSILADGAPVIWPTNRHQTLRLAEQPC